jgi:hypothetical protein
LILKINPRRPNVNLIWVLSMENICDKNSNERSNHCIIHNLLVAQINNTENSIKQVLRKEEGLLRKYVNSVNPLNSLTPLDSVDMLGTVGLCHKIVSWSMLITLKDAGPT